MEILETSDVRESISTAISGFRVVEMPPLPRVILDSFDTLPADPSSKQQYRRRATWSVTDGNGVRVRSPMAGLNLHNRSDGAFGVQTPGTVIPPAEIEIDVSKIIDLMLDVIHVHEVSQLRASVRQVRMVVDRANSKVKPFLGWNPDLYRFSALWMVRQCNVAGGEISIKCEETEEIGHHPVFRARQGIVLDRDRVHMHMADLSLYAGDVGYCDLLALELDA